MTARWSGTLIKEKEKIFIVSILKGFENKSE